MSKFSLKKLIVLDSTDLKNHELLPVQPNNRTYTVKSYIAFWTVAGSSVTTWSMGSSLLSLGLPANLAMACIVSGSFIIGILSVLCGWIGRDYHIGFTVSTRALFGLRGSYLPICLRLLTLLLWLAIQSYWGAQSIRVLIGAIIPSFVNSSLSQEFSESSHLQKNDLISMFIWLGVYFIIVFYVPPHKMQNFFFISFLAFFGTMIGLLAWSLSQTNGYLGDLFHCSGLPSYSSPSSSTTTWHVFQGITSVVGTWVGGALGQSDWTRFAKSRNAPIPAQILTPPITITITALIGIIVTSAAGSIFEISISEPQPWIPMNLLSQIQAFYNNSPKSRAAVFFASLGVTCSQLALAISLNAVSASLDLAAILPSYFNVKRGSLLFGLLAFVVQPWQLASSSGVFLLVLGGLGLFLVSPIGVHIATYFVLFRGKISIHDLLLDTNYLRNASESSNNISKSEIKKAKRESIYWYTHGFSIIGLMSFIIGVAFLLPGWALLLRNPDSSTIRNENNWVKLYNLAPFLGIVISFISVLLLSKLQWLYKKMVNFNDTTSQASPERVLV